MNVQRAFGSLFEGLSALWRELLHGPARLGPAPVDLEPIVDVICAAGDWTRTSVASATHASGVRVEVTDFDAP